MSPDTLASLLADTPYPGCVVTRSGALVSLSFDGLILRYQRDGWHFGDLHLESTLSDYSAPEQVHPEIRRILKVVMSLKVERALNEAEADGATDPVAYLTNLAAEKMLAILDVAALANARQAQIASNVAESAAREMRIAELERGLAAKSESLKTAYAALNRICELLCAPVPVCPEDAVTAVCSLISECEIAKSESAESTEIATALNDAGAPRVYHLEDGGEREIPTAERIRLLGERVHTLRAQVREAADATNYLNDLIEAHNALDGLGAPRLADGCVLSLAARVRSLPR